MKQSPYGVFPGFYRKFLDPNRIMDDWAPTLPEPKRLESFQNWRNGHVDKISQSIWPKWDVTSMQWVGGAQDRADEISALELKLLQSEFQKPGNFILQQQPICPTAQSEISSHATLYELEDSTLRTSSKFKPAEILSHYGPDLPETHLKVASEAFKDYGKKKIKGLFWFKGQFQRPRPNHAALCFAELDYVSEIAYTGMHSSIISGHSLIGALMMCFVYESWLDAGLKIENSHLIALSHFGMDHGDRRVFAGVHYPSDNLASWALASDLIPKIFNHANIISSFLKNAISKRSVVFDLINTHYKKHEALKPLVAYMEAEILEGLDTPIV